MGTRLPGVILSHVWEYVSTYGRTSTRQRKETAPECGFPCEFSEAEELALNREPELRIRNAPVYTVWMDMAVNGKD